MKWKYMVNNSQVQPKRQRFGGGSRTEDKGNALESDGHSLRTFHLKHRMCQFLWSLAQRGCPDPTVVRWYWGTKTRNWGPRREDRCGQLPIHQTRDQDQAADRSAQRLQALSTTGVDDLLQTPILSWWQHDGMLRYSIPMSSIQQEVITQINGQD